MRRKLLLKLNGHLKWIGISDHVRIKFRSGGERHDLQNGIETFTGGKNGVTRGGGGYKILLHDFPMINWKRIIYNNILQHERTSKREFVS